MNAIGTQAGRNMTLEEKYKILLAAMQDIAYGNLSAGEDGFFAEDEYIFAQRILAMIGETL